MRRPAGAALALTLMVLALLGVLLASAFSTALFGQGVTVRSRSHLVASEAARAGLAEALWQMNEDPTWRAGFTNRTLPASEATFSLSFPPSTDNRSGLTAARGVDGRTVPAGCAHLVSLGRSGSAVARSEALARVSTLPPLVNGVATTGTMILRDVYADSYDSSSAPYPYSASTGCDLRTDSTAQDSISLERGTRVYGNATVGPEADLGTVDVRKNSRLYGSVVLAPGYLELPLPTAASAGSSDLVLDGQKRTLEPGSYGDLRVRDGAEAVLQPGTYAFSTLKGDDDSRITLPNSEGPVYLHVRGTVDLDGTKVDNQSDVPARLWIIGSTVESTITIAPDDPVEMVVYAPNSYVKVLDCDFRGAVAAARALVRDASFHYDRALKTTLGPPGGLRLLARWGD